VLFSADFDSLDNDTQIIRLHAVYVKRIKVEMSCGRILLRKLVREKGGGTPGVNYVVFLIARYARARGSAP
jgi:hypothetical protein